MTEQLKPCPFCGGEAELQMDGCGDFSYLADGRAYIECQNCEGTSEIISTPHGKYDKASGDETIQKAIDAWNSRPSPWIPVSELDEHIVGVMKASGIKPQDAIKKLSVLLLTAVAAYDNGDARLNIPDHGTVTVTLPAAPKGD